MKKLSSILSLGLVLAGTSLSACAAKPTLEIGPVPLTELLVIFKPSIAEQDKAMILSKRLGPVQIQKGSVYELVSTPLAANEALNRLKDEPAIESVDVNVTFHTR